ncbi:MAG: TlpA disulfide reductase family protein [Pseudomonadota bacterium]
MTKDEDPAPRPSRRLVLAGGAALAIGIGAVYGMRGVGGNSHGCNSAREAGLRAAPLVRGHVASLTIAQSPISVSDLSFKDGTGAEMTMQDFGGRTILLNLWATWCPPCREEMPALDRLQARLGGDAFKVVAVSIDMGAPRKAKKFLKDIEAENLDFYADNTMGVFNTLKRRGRAIGMPTTMLVDPNGCEIGTMAGPAEWDSDDAIAVIRAAADMA